MKKTMIKRTLLFVFVIALAIAVYSSPAYCTSPSPSPTVTVSPGTSPTDAASPSTSPTEAASPESSPTEAASPESSPEGSVEPQTTTALPLKTNATGPAVIRVQMRLRDLGYFNYRPTGNYFKKTESAVMDFQKNNGLDVDGDVGQQTYQKLFSITGLVRKPVSPSAVPKSGPSLEGDPAAYGELGDWAAINSEFSSTAKITDFNKPDISFNVTRTGGTNLATVEASTTEDYNQFLKCFGGGTGWEKRSVLVTIGAKTYAASLFGNPGGEDTISSNGMDGHTTLYFFGSTTDVSGFIDKEDLRMVLRAAGKPLDATDRLIYDYCPGRYTNN